MPNAPKLRPVYSHAGLLWHKTELEARPRRGVPARVSLPKSRAEPLLAALKRGRSLVASVEQRGKVLLLSETDEDKLVPAGHGAKPHPNPYLIAMERLGVPAHDCVVFEDSRSGVRAGVAATVAAVVGGGVGLVKLLSLDDAAESGMQMAWAVALKRG